ncbi:MAG: hypothetical protein ACTSPI_08450 [Candidatus Heimdallarchaeaceae archaeon]
MTIYYPPTQNGLQKTLDGQLDKAETSSVTLNNTTGIQNKAGVFVVDRVDTGGTENDASEREYVSFTGVSGSTLTGLSRGLAGSSDQDHATGAIVEFVPDVIQQDGITDALDNAFTSAGAVDTTKIVTPAGTQTLTNKTLTAPVISTISNTGTLTLPTSTDTLVGKATTDTFTNKRITKRVTTITSSATPTINTDNCDWVDITALAEDITSMTTNLSGTPNNKDVLIFEIKDDGTTRNISWGASFVAHGTSLPTKTTANKILTVGFRYTTANSLNKWGCIASQEEG